MASLLEQLQGDDTLLMMYLVGELPVADRAEVERRLAADAKLRADLACLSETHSALTSGLEALDAVTPIDADVSAALRRASMAIRQWQARPAPLLTLGLVPSKARRWRVWMVPSAAAAIVLIVVGISFYSNSASNYRLAVRGPYLPLPTPDIVNVPGSASLPVPPAVSSQAEVDALNAKLIADTTPTASNLDLDLFKDQAAPGSDQSATHDDQNSKTAHGDGGYSAVFEVPLDSGQ